MTEQSHEWVIDRQTACLTFQALRPSEAELFLSVIETVIPHAQPELSFVRIATAWVLDSQMVADLELRAQTLDGIRDVDRACHEAHKVRFLAADDSQRASALRSVEDSAFFQALIHAAKADFYNRHVVWQVLGYPDLDCDDGYLNHGFDELRSNTPTQVAAKGETHLG